MAQFELLTDTEETYLYETDGCMLTDPQGSRVSLGRFKLQYVDGVPFENQKPFTPADPVFGKVDAPKVLKIQIGLGCNYDCSYCSQGGQKEESTSTEDAENFSFAWVKGTPDKIELWGGEPLLYWKKIEALVPKIRAKWPTVRLSIVTNGTLLTKARADYLHENGFTLAVSHDGPGQELRGEDPFDRPDWLETIIYAFDKFGDRICFNTVLTEKNYDLLQTILWFEQRMGRPVKVNVEDVVTDYGNGQIRDEALQRMYESVRGYCSTGLAGVFPRINWSIVQLLNTLAYKKPLHGANQVCQMDRRDYLAVDLNGNVLTCQNAGAGSGHKIGDVTDLAGATLKTTSYMQRDNCKNCPVVHLCYGSCMFLAGGEFESSCRSSYWYNRAIFEGVFKLLTGKNIVSISGWKPKPAKRVIPLKVTV